MVNTIFYKKVELQFTQSIRKVIFLLFGIILFIIVLTIFQDLLESKRSGASFNVYESILFKTVWFLFLPILFILYNRLKNEQFKSYFKIIPFIVLPIAVHLIILPFVGLFFSVIYFEGRYNLYKFFSYTITQDFYKLVIVYTSFVLCYKYFSNLKRRIDIEVNKPTLNFILINNGKENTIVNVEDIFQITSATPYITIYLDNKKYLHNETLKSICQTLDSNVFVRVHKSTVVNIKKVSSYKSRLNGDYDLKLTNGELIRLSRTYAADFKSHYNSSHRVN